MNPPPAPAAVDPLVYYNPARDRRSGLHALVIGVSAYPNLPRPDDPAPAGGWSENTLELAQLDSAALGACRVARWLITHHDQLTPPLASLHLLLTPTAAEMAAPDWLAGPAVPNPTLDNLMAAAVWRTAAGGHADSTTLFYFAGHGVQRRVGDHVLLLHDFGRTGPILGSTVSTTELIDGMRLSATRKNLARRQLYFFDACKLRPGVFKAYEDLKTPLFRDSKAVDTDDRQYWIFYATAPGHPAYGNVGGHSLFCEALLLCLNGGAAVPGAVSRPSNPLPWQVTIGSLKAGLDHYLTAVAAKAGTVQTLGSEVLGRDFQFRTFAATPEVEVEINIHPGHATRCAGLILLSAARATVKQVDPRSQPTPTLSLSKPGHTSSRPRTAGPHGSSPTQRNSFSPPTHRGRESSSSSWPLALETDSADSRALKSRG